MVKDTKVASASIENEIPVPIDNETPVPTDNETPPSIEQAADDPWKKNIRKLFEMTWMNWQVIVTVIVILMLGVILFGYYSMISFYMYKDNVIISDNATQSNNTIYPCVQLSINNICPADYLLTNTTLICNHMFDRIDNQKYPDMVCILNKPSCVENSDCSCLDSNIDLNSDLAQISSPVNHVLWALLFFLFVFTLMCIVVIMACLLIAILASKIGFVKELNTESTYSFYLDICIVFDNKIYPNFNEPKHKMIFGITLNWIIYILTGLLYLSTIIVPCIVFANIKGDTCEYLCNDCYYVNFTINSIMDVECVVDNNDCYKHSDEYLSMTHFNSIDTKNSYRDGVILIILTVFATIIYNVFLALLLIFYHVSYMCRP